MSKQPEALRLAVLDVRLYGGNADRLQGSGHDMRAVIIPDEERRPRQSGDQVVRLQANINHPARLPLECSRPSTIDKRSRVSS